MNMSSKQTKNNNNKCNDAVDQTSFNVYYQIVRSISEKDPVVGTWTVPTGEEGMV